MMQKLRKRLQGAYEPALVLIIIGVAALLMYALYRATGGGGSRPATSIVAVFEDVTGIKERSKVLFKGMPVGSVSKLVYDADADRILVRLDIEEGIAIPSNIQPYLESSLFGEAHIALKTDKAQPTSRTLASVAGDSSRDITQLLKIEGTQVSKAEALMPGFDAKAEKAFVGVAELTDVTKKAVLDFSREMATRVSGPVSECITELKDIIKGPEGQADQGLAAELQHLVDEMESHSKSLDALFNGKTDGSTKGLIRTADDAGGDWNLLVAEIMEGKDEAIVELQGVSSSIEKAEKAIAKAGGEVKKLGSASDKLGLASDSVKGFMEVIKVKPNSMVWGMNDQQKAMLQQPNRSQPSQQKR